MRRPVYPVVAAVAVLALAAFAVRAVSLDAQSLWRDEVDALRFAAAPVRVLLSNFSRPGWNGPLYFLLLRGWISLAGVSEYALRFPSLLAGVLCVPLTYALGRRLFDRGVGLVAAFLVAASPYLAWYGQEGKMYTLVSALVLLAIYGLRRAVEGGRWYWWAVQVVATSAALYTHILAALLIPVQVLLCLAWWPRLRRRWIGAAVSLACLVLPYLPLAAWQVPLLLRARETGFGHFSLGEMVKILLDGWSLGDFGAFSVTARWFRHVTRGLLGGWSPDAFWMVGLSIWGLVSPLFRVPPASRAAQGGGSEGMRGTLALMVWLALPPLVVWVVSQWQPLFTDRYFIWCSFVFYLLVAVGVVALWRRAGWGRPVALLLMGLVLVSNAVNLWGQAVTPGKAQFRAAAAYVAERYLVSEEARAAALQPARPAAVAKFPWAVYLPLAMIRHSQYDGLIVFQIPYGRYNFDYYFPYKGHPWADGLYTNHRWPDGTYMMSPHEAAAAMEQMTAGYEEVWLVATETAMWDERGLVQAWLDANARRVDEAHFLWVDVYMYEIEPGP